MELLNLARWHLVFMVPSERLATVTHILYLTVNITVGWGESIAFIGTSTHASCYATVRSLALPHIRHATLLCVLLHFHTYVMLRYCGEKLTQATSSTNFANFVVEK
jgi:hypothetical protein